MYLRDISVYADHAIVERFPSGFVGWFHRETCCITELYRSLLEKRVLTPDTVKVHLNFFEFEGFKPTVRQLLNVADAKWPFCFAEYVGRDVSEKKQMICDAVHSALVWIAEERKWDVSALEICRTEAMTRGLDFEGWSKKSWSNPDGKLRAKIGFYFGLRAVDFSVGVFDRRGRELGKKPLGSVAPEMGVTHPFLKGNGEWTSANLFRLIVGDGSFYLPKSLEVDLTDLLA